MVKKIETNIEDLKREKSTEEKTDRDMDQDVQSVKDSADYKPTTKGEATQMAQLSGVGPSVAQKLKGLGYTLDSLATARADEVSAEMGVSFQLAKMWVNVAQEAVLSKMVAKPATQVDKERKDKIQYIDTGSTNLNDLIGGGVATGSTTGLSGRFASGKTQICFNAILNCITVQKRKAVYIETEPNTFELKRLKEMADRRGLKNVDWDMIYVCEASQIPTIKAQFLQYRVVQKLVESGVNIGLVVIDSFNAKIRPGYGRREMLPIRTRELSEHFNLIDYLAAKFNIAWLLTCQVIGAPDPGQQGNAVMKTGDAFYPVGGEYLLHSVQTWVSLQQVKTSLWKATLYDSSYLPRGTAEFMLAEKGVMDGVGSVKA